MPAGVLDAVGIRQLPSGTFQVRFQLKGVAHKATFPTLDMAKEGELLMRAAALARRQPADDEHEDASDLDVPRLRAWRASPAEVTASSAEAAAVIDAAFADFDTPANGDAATDELLTTSEAAALLGISRPTLVAWLEVGRIPFQWRGSHRRLRASDVRAYVDGRPTLSDDVEGDVGPGDI